MSESTAREAQTRDDSTAGAGPVIAAVRERVRRSAWRSRCLACFGAVLLVVLLTAVGSVQPSTSWIATDHVALGEVRPVHGARLDQVPAACPENTRAAHGRPLPLALPRTRSILDRGLPPPRAPTA